MSDVVRLEPGRGWRVPDWRELLRSRELLRVLVARDVKIRYRQTILGAAWAVLQPLLSTIVLTILFNRVAKVPSQDVPYALFILAGLVPWTFFSNGVTQASMSLVSGGDLVRKVYFPRILVPSSSVLAGLVDLLISLCMLVVMVFVYQRGFTLTVLLLPIFIVMALLVALGVSVLLASLNVRYRDIRFVVPFMLQLWLFVTPVVYPSTLLSGGWRIVIGLNPMSGVIEGFRWSLLHTSTPPAAYLLVSGASTVVIAVVALLYFGRVERTLADVI